MSKMAPEGWSIKLVPQVANNLDSQRIPLKSSDRVQRHGQYRYYGASGIIDYVDGYLFDGEYILLGEDGENVLSRALPLAFVVSGKFWVNNHAHVLQPKKNIDLRFLCVYLESLDYKNIASGSAQPKITQGSLNKIRVVLPPLPEQQKISSILTSVDEVIEKTEAQISKLQDLKRGMMQELLTKGIGHTEFKDSPVGRVPKEWDIRPLMTACSKISDGIHTTPKYTDYSNYCFINGNNLKNSIIVIGNNAKYVSEEEYQKHKKGLDENTILMSINGTIGNLAYYKGELVVLGKSAAYINVKPEVSKEFIYYSLASEQLKTYFEFELTGTTIRNLSLGSIKNAPVAFPSLKEQWKIAEILQSLDEEITRKSKKGSQVSQLKKALMQDLLTGKKRVTL